MAFPTSYRWSAYITPNSNFLFFKNKIKVQSNKVCYKISLREDFQRQSCSITITDLTVHRH